MAIKNEKGITLVEVLAVLVISGIVMGLLWGIFMNGMNAAQRTQEKTQTQYEANLVTQTLRMHHLSDDPYLLQVNDKSIYVNGELPSDGYTYSAVIQYDNKEFTTGDAINIAAKTPLRLSITITDKNDQTREIRTTIQKEGES